MVIESILQSIQSIWVMTSVELLGLKRQKKIIYTFVIHAPRHYFTLIINDLGSSYYYYHHAQEKSSVPPIITSNNDDVKHPGHS